MRELRGKGVKFEEYDFPGLKTVNGIATTGDIKTGWFRDSEGNILAISTEVAEVAAQGRLTPLTIEARGRDGPAALPPPRDLGRERVSGYSSTARA